MNGKTLKEVDQFKCLGSHKPTSVKEMKIRLAQAHSVMTRPAILLKTEGNNILFRPAMLLHSWSIEIFLSDALRIVAKPCKIGL